MLNIFNLTSDEKCYEEVRKLRWNNGVTCPHCGSCDVVKDGHHEKQIYRLRYSCKGCKKRFDDLTNTVFSGHHQPLKIWILALYFMGLNLSNRQIAQELNLAESDAHDMTIALREGVVNKKPDPELSGEVEFDEAYTVAGHKGQPEQVKKKDV